LISAAIVGATLVLTILWEAFETIVLPRRVARRFRVTVLYYRSTWFPWRVIARQISSSKRRETFLGYFGPLSLLGLFVVWAAILILGFGFLFFSASRGEAIPPTFRTMLYLSGTTFFTLGLGDVTPHTEAERIFAVIESGLGFGFLALVLSYLPVIYQAFSRREVSIVLLDARAGSPPTAAELLRRHAGPKGLDALQHLLRDWERWSSQLLESHVSYPVLCYFRSQHSNESWIAALTAILDTSALLLATHDDACARQARLTFAICRHTVVDISQVFRAAPRPFSKDRLPPFDMQRMKSLLAEAGFQFSDTPEAHQKLAKLRGMYEPYLHSLAARLYMDVPPWILATDAVDNWRTSAWGRIAGLSGLSKEEPALDDHRDR
jgi:Ion channel